MKEYIKFTKALGNFICDKVEEGMSVAEICRVYADKMPEEKTIYRWRRKYPNFRESLDLAYQTKFWTTRDKMEELNKSPLPTPQEIDEQYKCNGDVALIRAYLSAVQKQRRDIFDGYRLELVKLAPKIVPELADKVTVEHQGGPQIMIQSYALPVEKLANQLEHNKDD